MGSFMPDCYGVSPWAIFVRPDSKIRRPEDLKDVPVSVGMRAGSHFNVPYRLEKYLPLEHIKVVNTGGFGARLRALLDGEVEAASLLPPQIDMAEQLGLRMVMEDEFHTLWWVPDQSSPRPCAPICARSSAPSRRWTADLAKYLPLWEKCIPPEFKDVHPWDFTKFTRGERFVYKPMPREEFDDIAGAGEALGPRPVSRRPQLREAELHGLSILGFLGFASFSQTARVRDRCSL